MKHYIEFQTGSDIGSVFYAPITNLSSVRCPVAGTLKSVSIYGNAPGGPVGAKAHFNVSVDGVAIWSIVGSMPALDQGVNVSAVKSGLSIAVSAGTILRLDLVDYSVYNTITVVYEIEDGIPSTSLPYDDSITHTTASMADAASVTETITVAKSCMLSRLTVDKPCRVRVYRNGAFATADLSRPVTTAATGQHGLVLDILFSTGDLDWWLTGSPLYINAESTRSDQMTVTVQNLSGAAGTVSLDFEALIVEA